jgi:hypothetical protein
MFDEIGVEEYYDEERHDSLWVLFVEGVEQETNAELQEIAEEQKSAQLTVELDYFLFGV